jgi:hypothetical protein
MIWIGSVNNENTRFTACKIGGNRQNIFQTVEKLLNTGTNNGP